jgi:hypothetical protein
MKMARTVGWGLIGSATTLFVRNATRKAMHDDAGAPRLPRVVRRNTGVSVLLLAAAAGAMFALGDVLLEQRRRNEFA